MVASILPLPQSRHLLRSSASHHDVKEEKPPPSSQQSQYYFPPDPRIEEVEPMEEVVMSEVMLPPTYDVPDGPQVQQEPHYMVLPMQHFRY